ncbi:MAG: hypothetical protein Q9172_002850 [Xanthocarpia lactea]
MSGLKAFVDRSKSSGDEQLIISAEPRERMQARMGKLGIHRQLTIKGAEDRSTSDKRQEHASSRQAIADRSRVSTPAFPIQRVSSQLDADALRPRAPQQHKAIIDQGGHVHLPFSGPVYAQSKSLGPFDTDSEAADDITRLSAFTDFDNFTVNHQNVSGDKVHPEATPGNAGASQLSGEPLEYYEIGHTVGVPEIHQLEAGFHADGDGDGDGDDDDQIEYDNIMLNENQRLERHSSVASTTSASQQRKTNQPVPRIVRREQEFRDPPDTSSASQGPRILALSGPAVPGLQKAYSNEAVSISSLEEESDMEGTVPLHSPNSGDYSSMIHDNTRESIQPMEGNPSLQAPGKRQLTVNGKRKYVSELSPGRPTNNRAASGSIIRSRSKAGAIERERGGPDGFVKQSTSYPIKAEVELDYDLKTLGKMTFRQLTEELFDASPQSTKLGNGDMSLETGSTLDKKLLHLHSLKGPRENIQLQRETFFSSLQIDQYEECGDLMAEHFGKLTSRFKKARQNKRGLAKDFEEEIAARQKLVESRKMVVTEGLDRLKRAGQDVVRGK